MFIFLAGYSCDDVKMKALILALREYWGYIFMRAALKPPCIVCFFYAQSEWKTGKEISFFGREWNALLKSRVYQSYILLFYIDIIAFQEVCRRCSRDTFLYDPCNWVRLFFSTLIQILTLKVSDRCWVWSDRLLLWSFQVSHDTYSRHWVQGWEIVRQRWPFLQVLFNLNFWYTRLSQVFVGTMQIIIV